MQEHWSVEQYREYQNKGNKKSKYSAVKTSVDGQTFDLSLLHISEPTRR